MHGRDFKFINGPDTNYTILNADVLLSMMLYDFGMTSASVKAAKMALNAANWQSDWSIQKVMVDVLENAYSTLHAQEVVLASQFSLEDAERMLNLAIELNNAGLSTRADVYIAKASYAQMKMDLIERKTLLSIQKGKLAASLGLQPDLTIQIASVEPPQYSLPQQICELISLANCQRTDLMAKRAELEKSIALQKKVRTSYLPKIDLGGRAGANHAVNDKANDLHYQVSVNFAVPLFTGFEAMYQNRMALADLELSRVELAKLELDISLEVLTSSLSLEGLQEMMPEAEEELKNSLKAYEAMLDIYKAGKEEMSAVSTVQRQLAASRIRYSDIKTRWLIAVAKLAYATGSLIHCQP